MDLAVIKEEIIVLADYFSKEATSITSTQNLNYEEIRRMPGASEDISRVIQSMPGVAVSSDMKNDIIVRGGSPSENLFMIVIFKFLTSIILGLKEPQVELSD